MAAPEIRNRAQLVKDYQEVPLIYANEGRLGQVLLNLLVNAAQAIAPHHADENEIRLVTRTDELGRAVVEVHDTGCGIPEELLGQLFRPIRLHQTHRCRHRARAMDLSLDRVRAER